MPEILLRVNVDRICQMIQLAQQLAGKVEPNEDVIPEDPGDDSPLSPMESYAGDPTYGNLKQMVEDMGSDEQADTLALIWVGAGDFSPAEWDEAIARAESEVGAGLPGERIIDQFSLAEYLIEGLQALGYDCPEDIEETGASGPGWSPGAGSLGPGSQPK